MDLKGPLGQNIFLVTARVLLATGDQFMYSCHNYDHKL